MERRIRAIQTILDPQTAALCLSAPSCRYLSGFEYTDGGVLITADQAFLLTDSRYTEAAVVNQSALSPRRALHCLLRADEEHHGKFKPLRGMCGYYLDLVTGERGFALIKGVGAVHDAVYIMNEIVKTAV
jgi:hypothetical protein